MKVRLLPSGLMGGGVCPGCRGLAGHAVSLSLPVGPLQVLGPSLLKFTSAACNIPVIVTNIIIVIVIDLCVIQYAVGQKTESEQQDMVWDRVKDRPDYQTIIANKNWF